MPSLSLSTFIGVVNEYYSIEFKFGCLALFFVLILLFDKRMDNRYNNMFYSIVFVLTLYLCITLYIELYPLRLPYIYTSEAQALFYGGHFIVVKPTNGFTEVLQLIFLLSFLMLIPLIKEILKTHTVYSREQSIIVIFCIIGMSLFMQAQDFITMYLALELQTVSLYILVAHGRTSIFCQEAGLKFFILSAFSSVIFLLGISLLYAQTGTFNLNEMIQLQNICTDTSTQTNVLLGVIFIICSLLFKLGAAPFHLWLADVYEGTNPIALLLLAILSKITGFAVLFRIYHSFMYIETQILLKTILISAGVLSIFVGVFGAFFQKKLRRLLAYSSTAHVGSLLVALSLGTPLGKEAFLFYLLAYLVLTQTFLILILPTTAINSKMQISSSNLQSLALEIEERTQLNLLLRKINVPMISNNSTIQLTKINQLGSLYLQNAPLALFLGCTLFSFAGIPPLLGFFPKYFLFLALIQEEHFILAVFLLLSSVLAAFYYVRLIKIIYFQANQNTGEIKNWMPYKLSVSMRYLLAFLLLIHVFFVFYPDCFLSLVMKISIL